MRIRQTRIGRVLFLITLFCCLFTKGYATHFAAADIKVDFIGADSTQMKYRVTLTVYKACTGTNTGQADLYATENIHWQSCAAGVNQSRAVACSPEDTIDHLCPNLSATNSCRRASGVFSGPGYTRRYYIDTFTLPSKQKDWIFWWYDGSRSNGIANITPPSDNNSIYVEAVINNTGRFWNNSSPRYLVDPFPYICQGQPKQYINGPVDPDFDSLITFSNVPLTNGTAGTGCATIGPGALPSPPYTPVPLNFGYTAANLIGSTTPYTVNPMTGTASFTPANTGQFVIGFRTEQYDRQTGEYLGRILRDAMVAVVPCSSPPPVIDTVPTIVNGHGGLDAGNVISICPNEPVTFTVSTHAAVGSNYIRLRAQVKPTAAFFSTTVNGGVTTGTFDWTPTTADIGNHVIVLIAEDTTCNSGQSIILESTLVITIRVKPGIDAGPDKLICPLGDNPVSISVSGPFGNSYSWKNISGGTAQFINCLNCQNVEVTPPYDYTYVVSTSNQDYVCKMSDTVTVRIDNSNGVVATQDPLIVCRPKYIGLTADPLGPPPVSNLQCGTLNTVTCTTPDQAVVGVLGSPAYTPNNTPFFSGEKYHKYQFIIPKQDIRGAGIYSSTLKSISFHHNNPTLLGTNPLANVRISLKCTRNTRYPSVVSNADVETGTTLVATVPVYALTANDWNTIPFSIPYNWDTTQNLLVDICMGDVGFVPNTIGADPVDMVPGQAIQRWSSASDICNANAQTVNVYTQRPVVRFEFCQAPNLPFSYQWAPGTYLADSNVQSPIAYVPASGNYAVYTWGRNGCKVRDSLHITVPIHHLTISNDTAVCVGQPAPLHAGGASAGYIWYENGFNTPTTLSCNNCADPVSTPVVPGDIVYTVVYLDTVDCFDTLQMTVHAYPLPSVLIGNNDTIINFGQSVQLNVTGANSYSWTPAGSLTDPNIPNPVAHPTVTTQYIVYGLSQYNCRSSDTVKITVNNRDNLLIPSGFTPNGDGKNDYFKVVNVTFQKLMEFRVFNRWGQEVFSTTDPMKGWDGTWKGVEQDLGNYTYIIRIAYPDGFTETYKGEVTLIR